MASNPTSIGYNNITIPSQDVSSRNSTIATNPNYFELTSGAYGSTSGFTGGLEYDLIQTSTVAPGAITYSFSNEIYKSYMRKLDINFISANLRPNRKTYPFFDGVDVSNIIQRPNMIEISGNSVFFGVITPKIRNIANVSNMTVTGAIDTTREKIQIGNSSADIIYTEVTSGGNTIIYCGEFRGMTPNDVITVGNTVTGVKSGATGSILSLKHSSGKLRFVPTTESSSFDANTFVNSNSFLLSSNGYVVIPKSDPNVTYGLKLGPDASSVDGFYVGNTITIMGGSIVGETSNIISYNAATKLISVSPPLNGIGSRDDLYYSIGEGRPESRYALSNGVQSHWTTSRGFLGGILRLPGYGVSPRYNFRVGKRLLRLSDNANNNSELATSIAEYVFCSYSVEEAQTISTGNNVIITTSSSGRTSVLPYKGKSPIAQSFFIDENEHPKGVFVPYIDVFFASKGTQPIEMQIRPMVNGYPDSYRLLKNATVTLQPEDVNVVPFTGNTLPQSANSSHFTRFNFPAPVYLQPGTEYAFLLVTNDYDYRIYASELGQRILGTNRIISEQPYLGSMFKSQNSTTYSAVQSDDIMFVIHICQFNTQGTITFNEYKDITAEAPLTGVDANLKMDMFTVMSDAIQIPGTSLTYRYQSTSFANNALDTEFTQFEPDQRVFLDNKKIIYHESYPTKSFVVKVDMSTTDPDVSPIIFPERQEVITAANYINNMGINPAAVKLISGGNNYTSQNTSLVISSNTGVGANGYAITGLLTTTGNENYEKVIGKLEFDSFGFGYYEDIDISIVSSDANTTGANAASLSIETEVGQSGGPALARYISKTVTLAPEFEAGDLRVYLTAAKPPEANVQVYYKVRNSYDVDDISKKNWVRMERKIGIISDSINLQPIELEFRPSLTSNNIIYSTDAATFDTFNQFKIKIVLASSSTSFLKIPYIFDMRAIALPGDDF